MRPQANTKELKNNQIILPLRGEVRLNRSSPGE